MTQFDHEARAAALLYLDQRQQAHRDGVPRDLLELLERYEAFRLAG